MPHFLSDKQIDELGMAEDLSFQSPVPTQMISNGEFTPLPQNERQKQIEALRRLEIPEDMAKKHGFEPLGAADGFVKNTIFEHNSARLFGIDLRADLDPMQHDGIARLKRDYAGRDGMRDNATYGFVARG